MLYQISNGAVSFGDDVILHSINFEIRNTEKIAIVGRNGCGKTTLLKLISGEVDMDKLDSDEKIAAESNFLTYSIVNYEGTVEAGESVELILLFKVTDTAEPSTIMPELYLDKDGSIYSVNL